mgnify:FL=1|jgi:single stranded DNA-binding protein (ssb)
MSLPTIHGVGRLTDDPDLRFAATGTAICRLRIAFNQRKRDANGEWVDGDVCFLDGTLFRQEAEHVAESLRRGDEVVITGRLKTNQYETREGERRSRIELLIDSIGPNLRHATAQVQKMTRSGGSPGASPATGPDDDPWAVPATARGDDAPPF